MKKAFVVFCVLFSVAYGQQGYDIRISLKGCTDTTVYLARYFFDQLPVMDSCKHVKNGRIRFQGKEPLERGVYFLANQAKSSYYFQFIVDKDQTLEFSADNDNIASTLKANDTENKEFFSYIRFMTEKSRQLEAFRTQAKGMGKADSAAFVSSKQKMLADETTRFDEEFMARNKSLFVHDLMNLKNEKLPKDVPLASNGRPDSLYQYYYYKNHFFDGVNFKDNRLLNSPFFADKVKKYFDQLVMQHPDSMIRELDHVLDQCIPGSQMFNTLLGHFTYKFEQDKRMSFDRYGHSNTFEKVFVHLADKYIVSGMTNGYYSDETVKKIKERVDILRNLLPDAQVPDLYMIDTTYGKEVLKMGFDTARSSQSVTYLYNKNASRLAQLYKTLYQVHAKYTVLVFWAADCGHCQTEIPKLHEELKKLDGKVDYKVYAVETKEELLDSWKKFIIEKKLDHFIHVFDPVHLNNLRDQFDINATPVIYLLDKDKRIKGKKLAHDQVVDIITNLEAIDKRAVK